MEIDTRIIKETVEATDLALSCFPDALEGDTRKFTMGVMQGLNLAIDLHDDPEFNAGEVVEKADIGDLLENRDFVFGALVGSLAAVKLLRELSIAPSEGVRSV